MSLLKEFILLDDAKNYKRHCRTADLLEAQTLNFRASKPQILRWIAEVKAGSKDHANLIRYSPFYEIVKNTKANKVGAALDAGIPEQFSQKWKAALSATPWDTDGVWSQQNFNASLKRKTDGKTFNFYITVSRTPEDVQKFFNALPKLAHQLSELSDKKNAAISFKTHRLLDVFMTHNDSLKVYFYDIALKSAIEAEVRKWAAANKIELNKRSHEHGVDISGSSGAQRAPGTGSHGQRIADKLADALINSIKQHGEKFTNEQYYEWIAKYALVLIKAT